MLDFGILELQDDSYLFSPAGKLQFKYEKDEGEVSNMPDVIAGYFSYSQDIFSAGIEGYEEKQFHGIGCFGKIVFSKNSFLLKIDDRGAHPFDSYKNFEGILMYGRELIKNDNMTLTLGGGLAATDTGLTINDIDIFIVPMPMLYFSYKNEFVKTEVEWIGLPSVNFTVLPEKMFQIRGNCSLAGLDLPGDIRFDCALCCCPLIKTSIGDLVYISAGISNNIKKFRIDIENSLKYQYYCAYGEISATALTVRAGYAFEGNKTLRVQDNKIKDKYDGGFFVSIGGMYKF
ncbi:MAG: hypothetical protein J5857_08530 [Treponema sp.]|nr:hypothetical protein [Treponema sp.]